ncbi:Peptidoglycan-binding domain 1 [hydrothermal vent metagenome]|uniref:Peptidoglycan-binding domain 1 n=1 Tax=hydrothermal vent metagenome TaxID=652676 RepID=A0A1W1EL91_9ZZZZ
MRFLIIFIISTYFLSAVEITSSQISNYISSYISSNVDSRNKNSVDFIYANSNNKPIWISSDAKIAKIVQLLQNIKYNYKQKPFDTYLIKKYLYMLDNENLSIQSKIKLYAMLDIKLTNSFVSLVRFVKVGDVDWNLVKTKLKRLKDDNDIKAKWEITPHSMPSNSSIFNAISSGNLDGYLDSLIPMYKRYMGLITILKKYQYKDNIKIRYGSTLKEGMTDGRIYNIKTILKSTGDLAENTNMNNDFDTTLKEAVISYQKRYNLKVTGEIDRVTTYYMNQPINKHIKAIIVNLDKTKIYPRSFEKRYLEANLADFKLRYYENGIRKLKMNIVVGKISRPTPIFSDVMKYIVINPTWTIPDSLIKKDLIYVLKQNPNYLEEHNIYVNGKFGAKKLNMKKLFTYEHSKKRVPYNFVQYPGDENALGRVKFMFPNKYAVYLHDTDNKSLLDRRYRIYSSGCMRVQNPFRLMKMIMGSSYKQSKIDKIIATNKPTTVYLKNPLPIHIIYFTVYQENGKAYFKNDIYMYDKIISESTEGNRKEYFTMPKRRLIQVDKRGRTSVYHAERRKD